VIKNTYRTLMTRGQKGCFVFSVDPETNAWLRARVVGQHGSTGNMLMAAEAPPLYEADEDGE
jgi:uncharacterized protein